MVEPYGQNNMSKTIWLGAVAYDPKVVTIWEGMRRYFHEEAHLPVEVVLFQSYEVQVGAVLAQPGDPTARIDIAWNTNLAYLQAEAWSKARCRPIAMRDTDIGWTSKIVAVTGGPIATLADLKDRTLALGSRDSGHAAILPVHFLERENLTEDKDSHTLRFNTDLGKHGDTGASEVEVVRAVLDGRADAGAIGTPFWKTVQTTHLLPGRRRGNWYSILEEGTDPASGSGGCANRDLDVTSVQSLHVYCPTRSRPGIGQRVRGSSIRNELRHSKPPGGAGSRRSAPLGVSSS